MIRTLQRTAIAVVTALVVTSAADAGGPLIVSQNGTPYVWNMPVAYRPDQGSLGTMNSADAVAFVENAFAQWTSIATAGVSVVNAGLLPADVDTVGEFNAQDTCDGGDSAIIFDADGSLFTALGFSSGVIGFAGPSCITTSAPFRITKGIAALNGKWRDGNAGNGELTADEFFGTFVHEFGHFLNLDHSQINGHFFIGDVNDPGFQTFGAPLIEHVEIMFPFALDGMDSSPKKDDAAAVSILYPAPTFASTTGHISGRILRADATTSFQGANVVARNVSDPFADAVSNVSGARFVSGGPANLRGLYELPGLTPGGSYSVEVARVNPAFSGGSGVGPISPVALPGPEEFYSGAEETANNFDDDPLSFVPVDSVAGVPTTGIDVVFNAVPPTPPGGAPSINETLACDVSCVDTYEVKCVQASHTLHVLVEDRLQDDCLSATLIATSPLSMLGDAMAGRTCGGITSLVVTRPTSLDGTITAFLSVYSPSSVSGARDYKVTAFCKTSFNFDRQTTLKAKQDE